MNVNDIFSVITDWSPCTCASFFFFVVFIVLSIAQSRRKKRHYVELRMLAAQNGWEFYHDFKFPFLAELGFYSGMTEKGWLGSVVDNPLTVPSKNVIQGKLHGCSFAVFEQTYQPTDGENRRDISQTLLAVESKEMNLPVFCLEPDASHPYFGRIFDSGAPKIDINFQMHPKFSDTYLLYGQDERAIRNVFTSRVLSFYEQYPPFTTVGGGRYLVIYSPGTVLAANQIAGQLNFLFALAEAFRYRR